MQYLIPILQGNFPNVETSEIVDIATESRGNLEAAKRIIEGHLSFHFCDFFFFFFFFWEWIVFKECSPSQNEEKKERKLQRVMLSPKWWPMLKVWNQNVSFPIFICLTCLDSISGEEISSNEGISEAEFDSFSFSFFLSFFLSFFIVKVDSKAHISFFLSFRSNHQNLKTSSGLQFSFQNFFQWQLQMFDFSIFFYQWPFLPNQRLQIPRYNKSKLVRLFVIFYFLFFILFLILIYWTDISFFLSAKATEVISVSGGISCSDFLYLWKVIEFFFFFFFFFEILIFRKPTTQSPSWNCRGSKNFFFYLIPQRLS